MAYTASDPNPAGTLPPVSVAALLESAMRARKSGNLPAARALLRALAVQQPNLPQVWLLLATVAETRAEQRHALEQVLVLDPQSVPAQRGLAHMGVIGTAPASDAVGTNGQPHAASPIEEEADSGPIAPANEQAPTPDQEAAPAAFAPAPFPEAPRAAPGLRSAASIPTPAARDIRWPLYLVIGVSALVVLIAAILIRGPEFMAALRPAPTAALPALGATAPIVPPAIVNTAGAATTPEGGAATLPNLAEPTQSADSGGTFGQDARPTDGLPQPTTAPPTAIVSPLPTPRQALTPGEVVEQGPWHAVLIRPDDALALDGSIGSFQPSGRFVLALLAIGNDGSSSARLPDDLFVLVDGTGKRYAPLPQISTAYLNTYGRGQHGDLSQEDLIPADGGNKSVPLLFDVPPSARPLYLLMGDSSLGWSIIP